MMIPGNLISARKHAGLSQKDLAKKAGVSQQAINKLENGGTKNSKSTSKIAQILEVSPEWLTFNSNPPKWILDRDENEIIHGRLYDQGVSSEETRQISEQNVRYTTSATKTPQSGTEHIQGKRLQQKMQKPTRSVPLINEVQAGQFSETIDIYEPGYAKDWVNTEIRCSKLTFALTVKGDSMEPEFKNGVTIIVDPEAEVNPGDYVIVRNNGDNEAVFKQLVKDGTGLSLMPINPRYDKIPLTENSEMIGKVIEQVSRIQY